MQTFDVSPHADVYPVEVLRALQRAWGHDVLLVGAVAVDVITHGLAGLRLGRATRDVDVAVAVSDVLGLDAWVRQQGGTPGLVARLYVNGIKVDALPFGDLATDDVVWRDGEVLNVAGLSDAYASAMLVDFGSDLILCTPTLAAMVALSVTRCSNSGLCGEALADPCRPQPRRKPRSTPCGSGDLLPSPRR